MKINFSNIIEGICFAGVLSVIYGYVRKKREEKQIRQSLNNLRESLLARAEMDRRVNFYYNNKESE